MAVEICENFDIKNLTTFKTGGLIERVCFPKNIEEFFSIKPPYKVFGNLSNTLVSSSGYDGTIVLTSKMDNITSVGTSITAGCGVKGPKLSQFAASKGLSGLEFMIGFPGSVGGEIFMNASANGQCISDCVKSVTLFCPEKGVFKLSRDEMEFEYRKSICQRKNFIVLEVEFELSEDDTEKINDRMKKNLEFRKSHQPSLSLPNCGSIFKNPEGDSAGRLLDEVGAKSMNVGGAKVWENHANFIVNPGGGSSLDILKLMCMMKDKVREKFEINLYPEVLYLGNRNEEEENLCKILYQK